MGLEPSQEGPGLVGGQIRQGVELGPERPSAGGTLLEHIQGQNQRRRVVDRHGVGNGSRLELIHPFGQMSQLGVQQGDAVEGGADAAVIDGLGGRRRCKRVEFLLQSVDLGAQDGRALLQSGQIGVGGRLGACFERIKSSRQRLLCPVGGRSVTLDGLGKLGQASFLGCRLLVATVTHAVEYGWPDDGERCNANERAQQPARRGTDRRIRGRRRRFGPFVGLI